MRNRQAAIYKKRTRPKKSPRMIRLMQRCVNQLKTLTRAESLLLSYFDELGINADTQVGFHTDISFYIVDFYFPHHKVAVELDGYEHDPRYDAVRDAYLYRHYGIVTLRFSNAAIYQRGKHIASDIHAYLLSFTPSRAVSLATQFQLRSSTP